MSNLLSELERLLAESITAARLRAQDPETKDSEWFHIHELFTSFAVGALRADPWFRGYSMPDGFPEVCNYVAQCIEKEFGNSVVVNISINRYIELLRSWCMDNIMFRKWNIPKDGDKDKIAITTIYSATPSGRDFIDLEAVFQSVAVYLRDMRRLDKAFDNAFKTMIQKDPDASR